MKIYKLNLSLKETTDKEYILTNGLGGYCSQTISSMNTRRYHGLLVKAQKAPARREVLVSKIDESIQIGEEEYPLYTNISNGYISNGFSNMKSFEYTFYPKMTYSIDDVKIKKEIIMKYETNTVALKYTIKTGNKKVKLNLTPLLTKRNFHYLNGNMPKEELQNIFKKELSLKDEKNNIIGKYYSYSDDLKDGLTILINEAEYMSYDSNYFENMYYIREEERGFDFEENLLIKGTYTVEIPKNVIKEIFVLISADNIISNLTLESKPELENSIEIDLQNTFNDNNFDNVLKLEKTRLKNIYDVADLEMVNEKEIILKSKEEYRKLEEFKENILQSADQFVVRRGELKTIIAGYHWFLDWGRDSLISFEGLLLKTGRFEDAKKLLKLYTKDIKEGLVPNAYDETTSMPYYNSADASLLLFEAVEKYLEYTNDYKYVNKEIYPKLKEIYQNYTNGTNFNGNNIYISENGLLHTGSENIQNTWMDAKIGDVVVTPRNGNAVEINALWYNAMRILENLAIKNEDHILQVELNSKANEFKKVFNEEFISKKGGLKDLTTDEQIRPNQLFSIALTHMVVTDLKTIESILQIVEKKLLNRYGLKTLAKGSLIYFDEYSGNAEKRDLSYHQGITWPWLLLLYSRGLENLAKISGSKEDEEKVKSFKEKTYETYQKAINQRPCINGISEICNSVFPYEMNGTITQAWSVAAIITILFK